jgi:hypothetical protein
LKLGDRSGEVELSPLEFEAHCREARVLERRQAQPVLLAHANAAGVALLTRVWYPKGPWTSDRFWPYSERFRQALGVLASRGIRVPHEVAHGRVTGAGVRFVVHERIDATPLRQLPPDIALRAMAAFAAQLHDKGVYCRSLNLGSVLALPGAGVALSDVSDTRLLGGPLPLRMRARNLGILCVNPSDHEWMQGGRWSDLVMAYCRAGSLSIAQAAHMLDSVRLQMARRQARRQGRGAGLDLEGLLGRPR